MIAIPSRAFARLRHADRNGNTSGFAGAAARFALAAWLMLAACAPALSLDAVGTAIADVDTTAEPTVVARGGSLWEKSVARPDKLLRIPLVRQGRDNTCGVACTQAVLRYAGYEFDMREDILLEQLGTAEDGTPIDGIVAFLNNLRRRDDEGGEGRPVVRATRRENMTLADLTRAIDAGNPVICLIQAWRTDTEGGYALRHDYARTWDSGHYVVAVGHDRERIYFMDPSTLGNYTYIPREELDARWHGVGEITEEGVERLEHAGITVDIEEPRYEQDEFYKIL